MARWMRNMGMPAAVVLVLVVGVALAGDGRPKAPIPEDHQARLLERFGDQGIDADASGALTREEIRAFFADKYRDRDRHGLHGTGCRGKGKGGPHGPGCHGKRGPHGGGLHALGMELHHLDILTAAVPPENIDMLRHAGADTDGDEQVSLSEWQAFAERKRGESLARLLHRLPEADANGDGALDEEELAAVRDTFREHVLKMRPEADTDADGVLSDEELATFQIGHREEQRARILERHPEADRNGDGTLSDVEFHDFIRTEHGPRGTAGRWHHGFTADADHQARILERHPDADTDGDGALSEEELRDFFAAVHGKAGRKHGDHHGCKHGAKPPAHP